MPFSQPPGGCSGVPKSLSPDYLVVLDTLSGIPVINHVMRYQNNIENTLIITHNPHHGQRIDCQLPRFRNYITGYVLSQTIAAPAASNSAAVISSTAGIIATAVETASGIVYSAA